jgi:hypothetical protein
MMKLGLLVGTEKPTVIKSRTRRYKVKLVRAR